MLPGYKRDRKFNDPPEGSGSFIFSILRQYNLKWICISCNIMNFLLAIHVIYNIVYNRDLPTDPLTLPISNFLDMVLPFWANYIFGYVFAILVSPIFEWEYEMLFK